MQTPTAHPNHRRLYFTSAKPRQLRGELPALLAPSHPAQTPTAAHDFLVPNPRPDLITDPNTLRMIDVW